MKFAPFALAASLAATRVLANEPSCKQTSDDKYAYTYNYAQGLSATATADTKNKSLCVGMIVPDGDIDVIPSDDAPFCFLLNSDQEQLMNPVVIDGQGRYHPQPPKDLEEAKVIFDKALNACLGTPVNFKGYLPQPLKPTWVRIRFDRSLFPQVS